MGVLRNPSLNLIPKRSSRKNPRSFPLHRIQQRSTSSQTEPDIPDEIEDINFSDLDFTRSDQIDVLKEHYSNAVFIINFVHERMNTEIKRKHLYNTETGMFLLPKVTNYAHLFSLLLERTENEEKVPTTHERKARSNFTLSANSTSVSATGRGSMDSESSDINTDLDEEY